MQLMDPLGQATNIQRESKGQASIPILIIVISIDLDGWSTWMSQEVSKWLGSVGSNPNIFHL